MANFVQGSTGTFKLLQGGHRTSFAPNTNYETMLTDEGRSMYEESKRELNNYELMYRNAEEEVSNMERSGVFISKHSVYSMDNLKQLGNPNYAMSHWVAAHPYYREMNQDYGYNYPLVEEGSEDILEVLRNVATDGIVRYDEEANREYMTVTSDSEKDVGFKKLKWRDKLAVASTHEFLDLCQEYGVDIFDHQYED